jgi:hypothetical protein
MEATHTDTPAELVFPPQVPFSWTLRSARARRLEAAKPHRVESRAREAASELIVEIERYLGFVSEARKPLS